MRITTNVGTPQTGDRRKWPAIIAAEVDATLHGTGLVRVGIVDWVELPDNHFLNGTQQPSPIVEATFEAIRG